ncbi:hypothetical protein [Endozoicomonas sp. 4G]|uniref:hypothetical protein n=1 Tax=Endozoicomonas sp. 4G TaxID=2872754 RepID=UPI0020785378|nr:hypothetical protein [Endozoicomonas sp. 4G]
MRFASFIKILSSLLLALALSFCPALCAANDETGADSLLPYDSQEHTVTDYIKSSGARVKVTKFMKGYSLTTSKKISVSVNPLGKSMRGSQPIHKIESKVRFQSEESDFLYYTLRGALLQESLFHLVLITDPEDSSKLYLGYYKEDENSVIDTNVSSSTDALIYLQDVLNKTHLTSHSTIRSRRLVSKEHELKPFKSILTLEKELDYSIEVVWKSRAAVTSVATPDTSAAIPENVGTQIVVKDKEGISLAALNLDLEPSYFSFSDKNGYLLEYKIDGTGIHRLTKIHTDTEYKDGGKTVSRSGPDTSFIIIAAVMIVGVGLAFATLYALADCWADRLERRLYENP